MINSYIKLNDDEFKWIISEGKEEIHSISALAAEIKQLIKTGQHFNGAPNFERYIHLTQLKIIGHGLGCKEPINVI